MTAIFVSLVALMALQAQTTVVLGVAERDLTGDGEPEILRLVGTGPAIDASTRALSPGQFVRPYSTAMAY